MPKRVVTSEEFRAMRERLFLDPSATPRLAERLRELRTEHGLSLRDLADICRLSGSSASGAWETHISSPDPAMMMYLADFYGVSLDYLFGIPGAYRDSPRLTAAKVALNDRVKQVDWTKLSVAGRIREAWLLTREVDPAAYPPRRVAGLVGGLEQEVWEALVAGELQSSAFLVARFAWALGIPERLLTAGKCS